MRRVGNRTLAAREAGVPKATFLRWTRAIPGSPKGGGFNPIHAHKHPERSAWAEERRADVRPGREPIAVTQPMRRALDEAEPVDAGPPEPEPRAIDWEESGDTASVSFSSDKLVKTEAEALAFAEVDTSVWYVKSWKCGGWSTPVKLRRGQDANGRWRADLGHVKQNWRVSLELARILPKPHQEALDAIYERIRQHSPSVPAIHRARPKTPHLLEVDLFDVHFGKLAWRAETGEDYDLKIAERIYRDAVEDLCSYAAGFEIDQIVLPVGQDLLHIDNLNNTTTAGTPQDVDGRLAKIVEVAEMSVIWAAEYLAKIAPLKVIWLPGNHDRLSSYMLVRTLAAWFRNSPGVEVDASPNVRKYHHYGVNLIGYTHGDRERPASLPLIMATEQPKAWSESLYREFHIGHRHISKRVQSTAVDTHDGVAVRTLQSLSGRDAWHHASGYVGGRRAAEAFLMARDKVMTANFQVSLR
jgi:hypothetical protein